MKETAAKMVAYILWVVTLIVSFAICAFVSGYFFESGATKLVSTIFLFIGSLFGGALMRGSD